MRISCKEFVLLSKALPEFLEHLATTCLFPRGHRSKTPGWEPLVLEETGTLAAAIKAVNTGLDKK